MNAAERRNEIISILIVRHHASRAVFWNWRKEDKNSDCREFRYRLLLYGSDRK